MRVGFVSESNAAFLSICIHLSCSLALSRRVPSTAPFNCCDHDVLAYLVARMFEACEVTVEKG